MHSDALSNAIAAHTTLQIPQGGMIDITPVRFSQLDHHLLYDEVIEKFGKNIVHAINSNRLAKMQRFLTTHAKYPRLMQSLKDLQKPLFLNGRLVPNAASRAPFADSRYFRKVFSLPYDKWNSSRYISTIGRQLNKNVSIF